MPSGIKLLQLLNLYLFGCKNTKKTLWRIDFYFSYLCRLKYIEI